MVKPALVSVDPESRLPEDVVERFIEDNMPEVDLHEIGLPRAVILNHGESSTSVPDGTFIVRLPA